MIRKGLVSLVLVMTLSLMVNRPALAHGEGSIRVEPTEINPGGKITVIGDNLEEGEKFVVSLEGLFDTFNLGEVEVSSSGFSVEFAIPSNAQPGQYQIIAVSEEGETLQAELTVLAEAVDEHSNGGDEHAEESEASAEPLDLDRSRSNTEWAASIALVFLSGVAGILILRKSE